MKQFEFENVEIEIDLFDEQDVITTSKFATDGEYDDEWM